MRSHIDSLAYEMLVIFWHKRKPILLPDEEVPRSHASVDKAWQRYEKNSSKYNNHEELNQNDRIEILQIKYLLKVMEIPQHKKAKSKHYH